MNPDRLPTGEQVREVAADLGVDTAALLLRRHDRRAELAERRDLSGDRFPPFGGLPVAEGVAEAIATMRRTRRNAKGRR